MIQIFPPWSKKLRKEFRFLEGRLNKYNNEKVYYQFMYKHFYVFTSGFFIILTHKKIYYFGYIWFIGIYIKKSFSVDVSSIESVKVKESMINPIRTLTLQGGKMYHILFKLEKGLSKKIYMKGEGELNIFLSRLRKLNKHFILSSRTN